MTVHLSFLHRWRQLLAFSLLFVLVVGPAAADPAGRVGRIAWLSGSVHLHRADSGESSTALLNWPLTGGDILSTGDGARAEVQVGSAVVQLDSASVLEFVAVDDQRVHLRLLDGSVIARFSSRESAREFTLSTPDGSFAVNDAGHYRFDAERSSTAATVAAGSLHFEASDSVLDIRAGQRIEFWNDGRTRYHLSAPVSDDFALWSAARDRQAASASAVRYERYVSPEMTGAADLDAYGRWDNSTEYGAVWFPKAVAVDWAPYRSGRWVWVAPWGWTWVGEEPWGFAPFHYGRWVIYRGAWGWVPGRRVARPVYAPALVAWIGTPAVSASVQIGARPAVGWFPLAPREIYVPPYRASVNHVRQVNVTHVTRITNITAITNNPQAVVARTRYAHRQLPRAVTVVPADVVTQRRPVRQAAMPAPDGRLLASQSVQAQAPLAVPPGPAGRRLADSADGERSGRQAEGGGSAVGGWAGGSGGGRYSEAPPGERRESGKRSAVPAPVPAPTGGAGAAGGSGGVAERYPGRTMSETEQATNPGRRAHPPVPHPPVSSPLPPAVASPLPAPVEQADRSPIRGLDPVAERPERRADGGRSAPRQDHSGAKDANPVPPVASPSLAPAVTGQQGTGADRVEAASRPSAQSEGREPRAASPTPPLPSPVAGRQGFERAVAEEQRSPAAARQSQGTREQPSAPSPPPPPASTLPDRPAADVGRQPGQRGGERDDGRAEQRQVERALRRDDLSRPHARQEMRSDPVVPAAHVGSSPQEAPKSRSEKNQGGVRAPDVRMEPRAEHRRSTEGGGRERKDAQQP